MKKHQTAQEKRRKGEKEKRSRGAVRTLLFSLSPFLLVLTLCGCTHHAPSWTHATPAQRAAGDFRYDYDFLDSAQFQAELHEDFDGL